MLAAVVPLRRATAVAVEAMFMLEPTPRTCMIVTGIACLAATSKLTPAIALLTTAMLRVWAAGSGNLQATDVVPYPEQLGDIYRRSFTAYWEVADCSACA
jgi:hypothetical protein